MKQKFLSLLLALAAVLNFAIPISAQSADAAISEPSAYTLDDGDIGITPYWTHISSVSNTLSISGNTATCKFFLSGYSTCKKITATARLQRYSNGAWVNVTTYYLSESGQYLNTSRAYSLSIRGDYRLFTTFNAHNSSGTVIESIDRYSYATY